MISNQINLDPGFNRNGEWIRMQLRLFPRRLRFRSRFQGRDEQIRYSFNLDVDETEGRQFFAIGTTTGNVRSATHQIRNVCVQEIELDDD